MLKGILMKTIQLPLKTICLIYAAFILSIYLFFLFIDFIEVRLLNSRMYLRLFKTGKSEAFYIMC